MELIDKEVNVWVCSVMELTFENVEVYLDAYKGAPLSEFAFLYDGEMGKIILIKEFAKFESYMSVVPAYLGADEMTRQDIRNRCKGIIPEDNFDILDMAIRRRICIDTIKILRKQNLSIYLGDKVADFIRLGSFAHWEKESYLLNYGIILGKRMERAKKAANRSERLTAKSNKHANTIS